MNRSQLAEIWEEYEEDLPTGVRSRPLLVVEEIEEIEIESEPIQLQACTDKPSSPAALARYNLSIETGAKHCSKPRCNLYACAPRYMHWKKSSVLGEAKTICYENLVMEINSARTLMQLSPSLPRVKKFMQLVRKYDKLFPGRIRPTFTPMDWLDRSKP